MSAKPEPKATAKLNDYDDRLADARHDVRLYLRAALADLPNDIREQDIAQQYGDGCADDDDRDALLAGLIRDAENGDTTAKTMIERHIGHWNRQGWPLSPVVRDYAQRRMDGSFKIRRGPKLERDATWFVLMIAIDIAVAHDFPVGPRRDGVGRECAASIVADVLRELRLKESERRLADRHRAYKKTR